MDGGITCGDPVQDPCAELGKVLQEVVHLCRKRRQDKRDEYRQESDGKGRDDKNTQAATDASSLHPSDRRIQSDREENRDEKQQEFWPQKECRPQAKSASHDLEDGGHRDADIPLVPGRRCLDDLGGRAPFTLHACSNPSLRIPMDQLLSKATWRSGAWEHPRPPRFQD